MKGNANSVRRSMDEGTIEPGLDGSTIQKKHTASDGREGWDAWTRVAARSRRYYILHQRQRCERV